MRLYVSRFSLSALFIQHPYRTVLDAPPFLNRFHIVYVGVAYIFNLRMSLVLPVNIILALPVSIHSSARDPFYLLHPDLLAALCM